MSDQVPQFPVNSEWPQAPAPPDHAALRFRQFGAFSLDLATRLGLSSPVLLYHGRTAVIMLSGAHLSFIVYRILVHWLFGATLGKVVFGIRVIAEPGGGSPGILPALIRDMPSLALAGALSWLLFQWQQADVTEGFASLFWGMFALFFFVGPYAVWTLVDGITLMSKGRSLHDMMAGTGVAFRNQSAFAPGRSLRETLTTAAPLVGIPALAGAVFAMTSIFFDIAQNKESAEEIEKRLGHNSAFSAMLPSDATVLTDLSCRGRPETRPSCSLGYATGVSLEELISHYRLEFERRQGNGYWPSTTQLGEWSGSWDGESHDVSIHTSDPAQWSGKPLPEGTTFIVSVTVIED